MHRSGLKSNVTVTDMGIAVVPTLSSLVNTNQLVTWIFKAVLVSPSRYNGLTHLLTLTDYSVVDDHHFQIRRTDSLYD